MALTVMGQELSCGHFRRSGCSRNKNEASIQQTKAAWNASSQSGVNCSFLMQQALTRL